VEARGRCSEEESNQFQLNKLGDEIAVLEKTLSGVEQSVGFCHNDLQYGNIMIYEETRQVTLIVSFIKDISYSHIILKPVLAPICIILGKICRIMNFLYVIMKF